MEHKKSKYLQNGLSGNASFAWPSRLDQGDVDKAPTVAFGSGSGPDLVERVFDPDERVLALG